MAIPHEPPTDAGWEYRVVSIELPVSLHPHVPTDTIAAALDELGGEGWELVAVTDLCAASGFTYAVMATFKRLRA